MRFMTRRLTSVFAALALAGVTAFAQTPPVPQTPTQQIPPATSAVQPSPTMATPAPVPCVSSLPGLSDATAMLDHIEAILNETMGKTAVQALASQKATSGATANKVAIDRDKLDEIRAEIAQIKVIVKK